MAKVPLRSILVIEHPEATGDPIAQIREAAAEAGVPVRVASRATLDRLSDHGAHQGVLAEARPYRYASLDTIIDSARGRQDALVVVCDHINDAGNLGAIVRSAEVVGAAGMVIPNRRAAQVTAATYKASAGAVAFLPIACEANIAMTLDRLKAEGFWVAGASEHAEGDVWDAPLAGRIALVLGSEGEGLSKLVQDRCDFLVALPQHGHIESLNVAQAATALMYEWLRRTTLDARQQAATEGEGAADAAEAGAVDEVREDA